MRLLRLLAAPALLLGRAGGATLSLDGADWSLRGAGALGDVRVPATVPGGVWDNLHHAGRVGDPLYRDNDLVYYNATTGAPSDWTLSRSFGCGREFRADGAALLEFEGIQTLATVSLNGKALLSANNMFRTYRVVLPAGLLKPTGNSLSVALHPTPLGPRGTTNPTSNPAEANVGLRDESDAWGWDWSPSLNPRAVYKPVRLVSASAARPHVLSFSPNVAVTATDDKTKTPTAFLVNASLEVFTAPHAAPLLAEVVLKGDWQAEAVVTKVTLPPSKVGGVTTVHAQIAAKARGQEGGGVELWWPLHYGNPNLHNLTACVADRGGSGSCVPGSSITKKLGFRSVGLYTGPPAPQSPAQVDPASKDAFVGCFRDGNIYWGARQHALQHLAGEGADMTVPRCIALCAQAGAGNNTLAGLQPSVSAHPFKPSPRGIPSSRCFCGGEIGTTCDGCLPGVGTITDPSACVWPCAGDPSVACGGGSYMWGVNSVYNVSKTTAASREAALSSTAAPPPPPPPPPGTEGSGNSGFAVVVNGVKIFGRGANLVPFELLEASATPGYIKRTMQSVHDGGMNMIRVWGGGMYQDDVFYEECDRLGITIYHDMAFSFRLYPHDTGFQDNVKAELADQIGRLRSHPSIVIWDTSNEDDADPEFFYDTVLTSIAEHDATRPLWPSSPSSGFATGVDTATGLPNGNKLRGRFQAELDTHQPYDYCGASFVTSQKLADGTYFKSEFGQVSLPAYETLAPALNGSAGDFAINSPILVHRKHACGSPRDPDDPPSGSACVNDKNLGYPIASLFGETDFADTSEAHFRRLIFLSQLAQTLCIKTKLEEFRRGSETFGALLWQLNDVWQASSWGSLDYGGRWRALHHSLQAIFAPTVASVFVDAGTLRVYASHHGSALTGADKAQLELNITNVATGASRSHMHTLSGIQGKSAAIAPVASLPLASLNPATEVVTTRLMMPTSGGGPAPAETVHLMSPPANMSWVDVAASDVALTVGPFRDGRAAVTLANNAKAPMFFALLTSTRQGTFSRNLLLVPPGEARATEFVSAEGATGGGATAGFKESLHLDWLNRAA